MKLFKMFGISLKLILVGIVLFSIIYPLSVGVLGQFWRNASQGSLIEKNGEIVGSKLIGQQFTSFRYFHSRPSSIDYNGGKSAGANLGPLNPELENRVETDLKLIDEREMLDQKQLPADILTESGSALDPHITPESAYLQVPRISITSGLSREKLNQIIEDHIQPRLFGIYGMKRVNVLELNLAIEEELNNG